MRTALLATRRRFLLTGGGFTAAIALGARWFGGQCHQDANTWAAEVMRTCSALRAGMHPLEWQRQIEKLATQVPVGGFLEALRGAQFPTKRQRTPGFGWIDLQESSRSREFCSALLFRQGDQIPPHIHHNTVSAHIVLRGTLRCRQYERISENLSQAWICRGEDRAMTTGDCVTMSDYLENAHWFEALEDTVCLTLQLHDVIPPGTDADPHPWQQFLGITANRQQEKPFVAQKLTAAEAWMYYGLTG